MILGPHWPILIDFGRACKNAGQSELDAVYKDFLEALCSPIETKNQSNDDDDYSVHSDFDNQNSLEL